MRTWRSFAVVLTVATVGAAGTALVAAVAGMPASDVAHLLLQLLPAALVTVITALIVRPLLARASLRQRFVAVALVSSGVALANLAVLTRQMFVSRHDATLVGILLLYSIAAGLAAALGLARSSTSGLDRLTRTAAALGAGDEEARAGRLGADEELEVLAGALDRMADDLGEARKSERRSELMRRDLITTISHDIRTPLASLRAMVEAIDDEVVTDPESLRRYAGEMRRSVTQLSDMVADLFELTQLDAGAIEAETHREELTTVVASAVAAVQMQADSKGLALGVDIDAAGNPPCSPRMARVLQNLLVNAVRHTPADGSVQVRAARQGNRLRLSVADTGEGIPPEDLPHVFDPFFRGDPARSGPSAGLGLTLAKRIVEALGGTITAQSDPAGALFAVELPMQDI